MQYYKPKYFFATTLKLLLGLTFCCAVSSSSPTLPPATERFNMQDTTIFTTSNADTLALDSTQIENNEANFKNNISIWPDSLTIDTLAVDSIISDSSLTAKPIAPDLIAAKLLAPDSLAQDSLAQDSTIKKRPFLTDIVIGSSKDSVVYNTKTGQVDMYTEGNVEFQQKKLNAHYINMNTSNDRITARGKENLSDTATVKYTKAVFIDGETSYNMDSINYNMKTERAKLFGMEFKEGEGTLRGKEIKKVDEEIFNIKGGTFSTCDADHPHFFLAMTKAQYVSGKNSKKMIIGPSYLVLEDVPLPLGIPFGFFPMMSDRNSGIILPDIGEENVKGFYLRGLGYYFVFNDYMDLGLRAGIYTMGSWEASATSAYSVRYKFNGNFNVNYAKDIIGQKGAPDYRNMSNYRIAWTHSQDPKFRPGSNFSANVNYSTSNFNKYDANNMEDYVSAQTNSSISYSKTWQGTPFSLSTNLQHSQSNRDSTVMLSLPNVVFNVSRINPFKRRNGVGKQRWYEKIAFSYTGTFNNTINTKQNLLFKDEMFKKDMKYGMKHDIPVSTSFNILKYLNISPSLGYTERWYFNRINKEWDPATKSQVVTDTTSGFYRVYDYRVSASLTTRIYGSYEFKGANPAVKAIRHVVTPSISGSFVPDFGSAKHGFYRPIQTDESGAIGYYTPYETGIYGTPGRGKSASMSFSLGNTLEMKVRSDTDTTGYKKVKILESLSFSSSYNFLADSMKLAPISISGRTTLFKSLGINFSATLDPYAIDKEGRKIKDYSIKQGKLVRLTAMGVSFGYSFRSFFGAEGTGSGTGSESLPKQATANQTDFFSRNNIDYAEQQRLLSQQYYEFSVPWNLSFNYTFSYSKTGIKSDITQTLGFNGSINLTSKFGLSFNGGFDFETMQLTPGSVSLTRDLHCWQMGFTWVPIGFRKSWNFNIRVKSGMLQDLKYEKNSGFLDNMYDSYY